MANENYGKKITAKKIWQNFDFEKINFGKIFDLGKIGQKKRAPEADPLLRRPTSDFVANCSSMSRTCGAHCLLGKIGVHCLLLMLHPNITKRTTS